MGVHSGARRVLRRDNRLFPLSQAVYCHRCRHLGRALYLADHGGRPRVPFGADLLDAGILDFYFSEPCPGQALHGAIRRTQPGRRRSSLRARLLSGGFSHDFVLRRSFGLHSGPGPGALHSRSEHDGTLSSPATHLARVSPAPVLDQPRMDADSSRRNVRRSGRIRDARRHELGRRRIIRAGVLVGGVTTAALTSWGRFPPHPQQGHPIYWQEDVPRALARFGRASPTLAYGCGRSYGDSCLAVSDEVLMMSGLSRLISADWSTGAIVAEAGLTIAELIRIALPQGWSPPVTPGTKFVTLGGAVANDVHGQNHHVRGTFGRHVDGIVLLRSDHGRLACSRAENAELFEATIGGLGLTGVIERVRLRLVPIRT